MKPTCSSTAQTNRFKAACAGACVSNMHSDYGTSDIMWADEHEYGGKPWEDAGLLFYMGLRRLGKTAVMVRYPEEFHGLRRPLHRIDRFQRMLAWFDYYRQQ